jgi:hypothetical protein
MKTKLKRDREKFVEVCTNMAKYFDPSGISIAEFRESKASPSERMVS